MKTLGLVGFPLGHSFSAKYFKEKFDKLNITDFEYLNFEMKEVNDILEIIRQTPSLIGFNITIPHKENILPLLDELSPEASAIGAVNTVKIYRNIEGKIKLRGFNTDCYGFQQSIKPFLEAHHHQALILGTGGAAKAVEYVLKNLGLEVLYVSRSPKGNNTISYKDLNEVALQSFPFVINSTPLGMHPNIDACPPIPYQFLSPKNYLYDLIYNPEITTFLNKGKAQGAIVQNGLQMLQLQAEKAWEIWTDPSL